MIIYIYVFLYRRLCSNGNNCVLGKFKSWTRLFSFHIGGARGVMVIVIGNGHGDTSSNPGRD